MTVCAITGLLLGVLSVCETGNDLSVLRNGQPVVSAISVDRGIAVADDVRASRTVTADGTKVWNRWSEVKDRRFRLEVAEHPDGTVEISLLGQMESESKVRRRELVLTVPQTALKGKPWRGVAGAQSAFEEKAGTFGDEKLEPLRYLASDGLVFDFNPLGPYDGGYANVGMVHDLVCFVSTVRGYARVAPKDDVYELRGGGSVNVSFGGFTGAKFVLREGTIEDYDRHHAMRRYDYSNPFFWKKNVFDFPAPGYYMVEKSFLSSDGRRLHRELGAVHTPDGKIPVPTAERRPGVTFAVQPILADSEDFQIARGFWVSDGYEPTTLYRNADARVPFTMLRHVEDVELGDGTVPADVRRGPVVTEDHGVTDRPCHAWTKDMRILRILDNASTFAEFDDPADLTRYLDRELAGRDINAVMLSGMLSRHTYVNHEQRGLAALKRITDELHRRGLKVLDHEDVTLLWNVAGGFRVLMENPAFLNRFTDDNNPGFQYCLNNPDYKERFFRHLEDVARTGVDVLQLDELYHWYRTCVCRHCRESFARDTGILLPLDNAGWYGKKYDEVFLRWREWRPKNIAQWYSEARARVRRINPDILFSVYETYWGYTESRYEDRACDPFTLAHKLDVMGCESMTRASLWEGRSQLPLHLAMNTTRRPLWDWTYSGDWQNDYAAWALATMAGHAFLFGEVPPDPTAVDYSRFTAARGAFRRADARPVADVALLYTQPSRDWNRGVLCKADVLGRAQTLDALHVPYEIVGGPYPLDARELSRFRALDVGASECLSDADVKTIRDFAAAGGTVRLSALAGTCDEFGQKRGEWPFADVFGIQPTLESNLREHRENPPYSLRRVRFFDRVWTPETVKPFGKGTFAYAPGSRAEEFDQTEFCSGHQYWFFPDAKREAAFRAETRAWTDRVNRWRIDAPAKVLSTVWREGDGALVVQLLNLTHPDPKLGEVVPVLSPMPAFPRLEQDVTLDFPAPETETAEAFSPEWTGAKPLSVASANGRATVVVPNDLFEGYVLIRLKGKWK